MATNTTTINFDGAMKQIYRPGNVAKLTFNKHPLFGMLPKFEGFGGRNMPVVAKYGHPQGRSVTFATAQAIASEVKVDDFLLTRVSDYGVNYIDGEAIEATRGDGYAFLKALSEVIDGTLECLADSIETKLFRTGSGAICQTGAGTVANPMVLTLTEIEDITNFEINMQLVASATETGAVRTTPAQAVVAGVDRSLGTITTDYDNSGATTNWAASDYLHNRGDAQNGGASSTCISGLAAWCTVSAPVGTFHGVNRIVDSRLYGLYHDASGGGKLEDHGIQGQSKCATQGGNPSIWIMHHAQLRKLAIELGAKKMYATVNARDKRGIVASIGFKSIVINGDHGDINVVPANKCQATTSWMLTIDEWLLATLGSATKIIVDDGLRMMRASAADAYEIRTRFRGNLCTRSPIRNVRMAMASP